MNKQQALLKHRGFFLLSNSSHDNKRKNYKPTVNEERDTGK